MRTRIASTIGLLALLASACAVPDGPPASVRLTDHHVHLLGPDVMRDWHAVGVTFSRPDSIYTSVGALLRERPDTNVSVVLVPMAHLYGNTEFSGALGIPDSTVRTRVQIGRAHV